MSLAIRPWFVATALLWSGALAASGPPGAEPQTFSARAVRADFAQLYETLQTAHFDLYARRSKPEYDAMYRQIRASLCEPMSTLAIQKQLQMFLAYGRVAHANIAFPMDAYSAYRAAHGAVMPLYVRVADGVPYVTANYSGLDTVVPGDALESINGQPIATVLERLRAHVSADNDYLANTLMEPLLPALLWLDLGPVAAFDLGIRHAGEVRQVQIPARSRAQMQAAAAQLPATSELDWSQREARITESGVAYLRPGPFYNSDAGASDPYDTTSFSAFLDQAFQSYLAAGCKALLIDLRDNSGGDSSFSDQMVSWFADRPFRFASSFRIKVSQAAITSNQKRITAGDQNPHSVSNQLAAA